MHANISEKYQYMTLQNALKMVIFFNSLKIFIDKIDFMI